MHVYEVGARAQVLICLVGGSFSPDISYFGFFFVVVVGRKQLAVLVKSQKVGVPRQIIRLSSPAQNVKII